MSEGVNKRVVFISISFFVSRLSFVIVYSRVCLSVYFWGRKSSSGLMNILVCLFAWKETLNQCSLFVFFTRAGSQSVSRSSTHFLSQLIVCSSVDIFLPSCLHISLQACNENKSTSKLFNVLAYVLTYAVYY